MKKIISLPVLYSYLSSLFLFSSSCVFADVIYQWTDPWGQIQYSKTPVRGAMISELTELPKSQVMTEQAKLEAMLNKMQKIKNENAFEQKNMDIEKRLNQQKILKNKHCRMLREQLSDIRVRNSRVNYLNNYYPQRYGYYSDYSYRTLENDLYANIRQYCR